MEIYKSEMIKNELQIFMRLIILLESMNQCATSVNKIGTLTFLVKQLELPEIACYLLQFLFLLAAVFNEKLVNFSGLFCIQIVHFAHNLHSKK